MYRKFLLLAMITALAGFGWPTAFAQAQGAASDTLRSIAVLEFELVDEQTNPLTKVAQEVRLRQATLQLRQALGERRLYSVADQAASQTLQDHLRSQQEFFYRCDDCAAQVGKLLGVELVMTPWVQKVSELILNLNVQIYDVQAGKPIFSKSVDMRGNTDESWRRAVFLSGPRHGGKTCALSKVWAMSHAQSGRHWFHALFSCACAPGLAVPRPIQKTRSGNLFRLFWRQ